MLPPVSKLTAEQAMYQFISGYTAKVAGTEIGVTEPVPDFSACYGAAFLSLHPTVYAELLAEKIREHDVDVWLVNTGWTGGSHGVGHRFELRHTRAIVDAILGGHLRDANYQSGGVFGLAMPDEVPGVPSSADVAAAVDAVAAAASTESDDAVRAALAAAIPDYAPAVTTNDSPAARP